MEEKSKNGLGTAGLVLGIIGVCISFIPIINFIVFIMGILAIIFGIIGLKRYNGKRKSITAIILGSISLFIVILTILGAATILTTTDSNLISDNNVTSNTDNSNSQTQKSPNKNSISEIKLNEAYTISDRNGEYLITFEGVRETSDRNQFSDVTPKKVIFVDYNYENVSCVNDVYISSISYKVLDDSGNVLDTYPVSDDTRNNKSCPIGGKSKGTDAFAIMTDTKTITILYYDFGIKPLGKLVINL